MCKIDKYSKFIYIFTVDSWLTIANTKANNNITHIFKTYQGNNRNKIFS